MKFAEFVDHERVLARHRGKFPDDAELERRAVNRILEGYCNVEEAIESVRVARMRGNEILGADIYGFWVGPRAVEEAVQVKKRAIEEGR